jgi:hypothetical protein
MLLNTTIASSSFWAFNQLTPKIIANNEMKRKNTGYILCEIGDKKYC